MSIVAQRMSTDEVAPSERAAFWSGWIDTLFHGLRSDTYGDATFSGRMATLRAGDVVMTRLEADRHRVIRSDDLARTTEVPYVKIVAPWVGCAGVEQGGRQAWVTPDQWSAYDTTDRYAVANPVRVEHLIVMVPKQRLEQRGLPLEPLMARRFGGNGGVSRLALETMRSTFRALPGMSESAAGAAGEAIAQFVQLSLLELAGVGSELTQLEALRDRIKRHVDARLGDPDLSVDSIADALSCSRRQLYNAFSGEPDGVAGYIRARRLEACSQALADRASVHRSITEIALAHGFSNMAHFSRLFRAHLGVPPRDYRRAAIHPAV